jgi:membrane protein implicated in regulation of membrane protease activity
LISALLRGIGVALIAIGGLALLILAVAALIVAIVPGVVLFLGVRLFLSANSAQARAVLRRWLQENRLKPGSATGDVLRRRHAQPAGRRA